MKRIQCPYCGEPHNYRDSSIGNQTRCVSCGNSYRLPAPAVQNSTGRGSRTCLGCIGLLTFGGCLLVFVGMGLHREAHNTTQDSAFKEQKQEEQKQDESNKNKPEAQRQSPVLTENFGDYYIETKPSGELMIVQITFRKLSKSTDTASKIVRAAMERAVAKDGSREILAKAFNEDGEALPDRYYGGALTYKPSDGSIKTMDERRGVKIATRDNGAYFCKVKEEKTLEGITPSRSWLTCELVFADSPSGKKFKDAALVEIKELGHRQLNITVYAYVGDKSNPITWRQVKAANGNYMMVKYEKQSGSITMNWAGQEKFQQEKTQREEERKAEDPTEAETAAANDLKKAKELHLESLKPGLPAISERLEREYIEALRKLIKKYPASKAAKEAKELLDKRGR